MHPPLRVLVMGNYGTMLRNNLLELGCAEVGVTDVFGRHRFLL